MTATITKLLNSRNININDVASLSHVPVTTLRSSIAKPIDAWSVRVLKAFATSLNESAGDLLNILDPNNIPLKLIMKTKLFRGFSFQINSCFNKYVVLSKRVI